MISQRCPKCLSDRVRHGYRPTPIWSKFLMRYNLLCDKCNWEFVGFAVPGTISYKPTKRSKKKRNKDFTDDENKDSLSEDDSLFIKTAAAKR